MSLKFMPVNEIKPIMVITVIVFGVFMIKCQIFNSSSFQIYSNVDGFVSIVRNIEDSVSPT